MRSRHFPNVVLYPILLIQSWSTTVPNFMLVSGIAQSRQNLALSRLAITVWLEAQMLVYEGRSICNENCPVYPKVLYLHT